MVKFLVENGCRIRDKNGIHYIHSCAKYDLQTCEYLLKGDITQEEINEVFISNLFTRDRAVLFAPYVDFPKVFSDEKFELEVRTLTRIMYRGAHVPSDLDRVMGLLIEKGIDINYGDGSLLRIAASGCSEFILKEMMDHGADFSGSGNLYLKIFLDKGKKGCIDLLRRSYGEDVFDFI